MPTINLVVEVNSWTDTTPTDLFETAADNGAVGALLKVSQGTTWINSHGPELARRATAAGLLLGALHYWEPTSDVDDGQVSWLLGSLPPVDYALGVVVEIDALGTVAPYEASPVLQAFMGAVVDAGHLPGVMVSAAQLAELTGAPWGARWWATGRGQTEGPARFAERLFDQEAGSVGSGAEIYALRSLRGVNRPGGGAAQVLPRAAVAPPEPAEPDPAPTTDEPESPDEAPTEDPAVPVDESWRQQAVDALAGPSE